MESKKGLALKGIPRENIFSVPERYFNNLPSKIQEGISEKTQMNWKGYNWFFQIWKPAVIVIIILAILVVSVYNKNSLQVKTPEEELFSDISPQEIEIYLEEIYFDNYQLMEIIETDGLVIDLESMEERSSY